MTTERYTHLLDWLLDGYGHCQRGTEAWCKGYLDNARAVIIDQDAELARLRAENERLRAALAQSDQPCAYCTLPAEEWGKCAHGFPGCSRTDDAMGCPELGAKMENERLRRSLNTFLQVTKPISDTVYDDNGDKTVTGAYPYDLTVKVWFAAKAARAALAQEGE